MEDKRRRARVQGAWAGPAKSQAAAQQAATAQSHLHQRPGQTWMNKEHHLVDRQFVFREPQQVVRRPPAPRVIDKEGVYEISVSPTGISRVCLYPGFIDLKEANWVLEQLCEVVPWKQRTGIRDWHPVLRSLKDQIEENTGHTFNSLLCNLYRNEKDSVDWHSDDEPSLGRCPVIASLSFGATRTFEMRRKPPPEENGDYTYVERVKIPLDHGTLLIMEGATQADWQHRVPKEYHSREPRINLTFRTVYPDPGGAHW
ncbi:alpha-ketoglutarate-dependent dioxygenase alkB homolog 3 isoform X3 [Ailuropoda melanoleuca]|uniref:alpha-ketoglutarate-dependent dioxygenase alkB homolog 3 isoform X3 n=1 Tax=Ailuropoda melanoleuca TaxID=9646 RepID=UPI000947C564|nr:alpha-ketoglutarate-dependent dioxygenase alkB homolog 3 isoform X3 [Ailuropoda melanoleuca]